MYRAAKLQVAVDHQIPSVGDKINFLRDEHFFINTYLSQNMEHNITSSCNSPFCPEPFVSKNHTVFPTIHLDTYDGSAWRLPVLTTVEMWLKTSNETRCARNLQVPTEELRYMFWDENKTTQ